MKKCCGQCNNLVRQTASQSAQKMMEQGFFRCSKLPVWQYVSPARPACTEHSVSSPAQPVQQSEDFDLAELF